MLTEHRVLPIALGDNWVYALPAADPADGLLLVDAGPDYDGSWETLVAQLDAAGLSAADVRTVLITHAHIDHCGLAARWQAAGAEIVGAREEAPRFAQGDRVVGFQAELVFAWFAEAGVPPDLIERFRARRRMAGSSAKRERMANSDAKQEPTAPAAPQPERAALDPKRERNRRRERWPGFLRGTPFQADREPRDGETVRVGDRQLRFIAAPGHTPGNAVAYEAATGALFSGDQLLPHITPNPGIHFTTGPAPTPDGNTDGDTGSDEASPAQRIRSLPAFSRSLRKLQPLHAAYLYPGHGEPAPDVAALIDKTLDHHRRRQERLLRFLRDGPLTAYALMHKFFPHLPGGRLWQAMAEVTGHIDALVEAGAVVEQRDAAGRLTIRAI